MISDRLRYIRYATQSLPWRLAAQTGLFAGDACPVQFVIENADWAIRWVGENIRDAIEPIAPGVIATTTSPYRHANSVVHFGSQYMWLAWEPHISKSNRAVTSFFHGKREDGDAVSRHIDQFLDSVPRLAKVVTAASLVENRLVGWGVPREKIERIPIGVDTTLFRPPSGAERHAARAAHGISPEATVIGSFQKDGVGWGDGMEPKLIKGPDIFLQVIDSLRRDLPVHVFLTGPARGYVKKGLEDIGVPFTHAYAKSHAELTHCYHALDLYLVTSREEGGPMGLMESMASGVPVVSSDVGMAPDLIEPEITGGLVPSEAVAAFSQQARRILELPDKAFDLRRKARQAVKIADWQTVGAQHYERVYRPLLNP